MPEAIYNHHCQKCGLVWTNKIEFPSRCPKVQGCGSYAFDTVKGEVSEVRRGRVMEKP